MQLRTMQIVALAPFVIGTLIIGMEVQYIIEYYIKSSSCYFPNYPDVVPGYEGVLFGSIPIFIGVAILMVDWIKHKQPVARTNSR
jgi:hypothetical protein